MCAVPPHGDRGGLPDDCPHRQHSADSSHRGDLPCQGDEEQRPGQRHVQVQTLRTRSSCAVTRLNRLQIHQKPRVCESGCEDSV